MRGLEPGQALAQLLDGLGHGPGERLARQGLRRLRALAQRAQLGDHPVDRLGHRPGERLAGEPLGVLGTRARRLLERREAVLRGLQVREALAQLVDRLGDGALERLPGQPGGGLGLLAQAGELRGEAVEGLGDRAPERLARQALGLRARRSSASDAASTSSMPLAHRAGRVGGLELREAPLEVRVDRRPAEPLELAARGPRLALRVLRAQPRRLDRRGQRRRRRLERVELVDGPEEPLDDLARVGEPGDRLRRVELGAGSGSAIAASLSAAARARFSRSASTHGVSHSGRKAISVPAVRQPGSHAIGSSESAVRSARTTTGCWPRRRMSICAGASSKARSSRKSEKSKPSSSLTGIITSSMTKACPLACWAWSSTLARAPGATPDCRNRRQPSPLGRQRRGDQRVEERPPEDVGAAAAEEQVGGLAPLRDGALAVREDEGALGELPEQRIERLLAPGPVRDGAHRRPSQSSSRTAAARESSLVLPPAWAASLVVKRSSSISTGTSTRVAQALGPRSGLGGLGGVSAGEGQG